HIGGEYIPEVSLQGRLWLLLLQFSRIPNVHLTVFADCVDEFTCRAITGTKDWTFKRVDSEAPARGEPNLQKTVSSARKKCAPSPRLVGDRQHRALMMEFSVRNGILVPEIPGN